MYILMIKIIFLVFDSNSWLKQHQHNGNEMSIGLCHV